MIHHCASRAAWLVTMAASGLLAGCSATGSSPTSEFATFGRARIQGRATNAAGQPLDSVIANVVLAPNRAAEFTTAPGLSTADGRFQLDVVRIIPTANATDTVTLTFVAAASSTRFRGADGTLPRDTTRLTVRLGAPGAAPTVVNVDARIPVP
jgi:hypothetical protein